MKKGTRILAAFLASLVLCGSVPFAEVTASGNETDFAGAKQEDILETMEQVSDIRSTTPVENQIVVVYEEEREDNVRQLRLSEDIVEEGESISEMVDVFTPDESVDTDELIKELESRPGVAAVSRNEVLKADALPNDPYITDGTAWQFQRVRADNTWNRVNSTSAVKVAVIDQGVNILHEDLFGRCEIGYDYVAGSASSMNDYTGHGTAVSGLIAATANNGKGIAGIAGGASVKIVAYRVGGVNADDPYLDGSYTTAALLEIAKRDDIQVVSMSFGGTTQSSTREEALKRVAASGKVLVASAGNEGNSTIKYPASFDKVISVASTDINNNRSSSSNYNKFVDLSAPGVNICTTSVGGGYFVGSGSSFSTPIVAGAAAVVKCANNALTPDQVERVLKDTAKDLGSAGRDDSYGYGLIQLDKAVEAAQRIRPLEIASFTTDVPSPQYPRTDITLTAAASGGTEDYEYRFQVMYQGDLTTLKDYWIKNTCTWTPTKVGVYTLYVSVRDSSGKTVETSKNFVINRNTYHITSFTTKYPSPQNVGNPIYLYAKGTGPGEPRYKFTVTSDEGTTVLKDFETEMSALVKGNESSESVHTQDYETFYSINFKPEKTGIYTFRVYLKDAGDPDSSAVSASLEFEVVDRFLVQFFTVRPPLSIEKDKTGIFMSSMGSGETGDCQYCFTAELNGVTTTIQEYSEEDSVWWKPTKPGAYTLTVYIKDSTGEVVSASKEYELGTMSAELPFTDVQKTDWFFKQAAFAYQLSIMKGLDNTTFGPDEILSRGQFATILYRMEGCPEVPYCFIYNDVYRGYFYTDPVHWAYTANVITGYGNGYFGPADSMTREQLATIMYRYCKYKNYDADAKASLRRFPDQDKVSGFAREAMEWAVAEGIISGDQGRLNPQGIAKRAVTATIIMRFMEAH